MGQKSGINLTKAEVVKIQPGEKVLRVWDTTRGLGLQVTPSGVKSWVLSYRVAGQKDMITLGRWPEMTVELARAAAISAWKQINAGENPNQAKRDAKAAAVEAKKAAVKVKDLVERYIEEHVPTSGEHWAKEAPRLLNKHVLPLLGEIPLKDIGPADISKVLYKIKDTPRQSNLVHSVLRTMFRRAEEWDLRALGSNPVAAVKKHHKENKRDRRLSDLEIKALGQALRASKESAEFILAIRLALLAGMRKGEIQGARWGWVDLEAGEIRIPPEHHKTGKKTGKVRVVHLCSALVADLKAIVQTIGCPYVIPGRVKKEGEKRTWQPFTAMQNIWERTRDAAGLAPKNKDGEYLDENHNPTLHDLRRTFASVAADLGLGGFARELLGHAEATVTDIYTRPAVEPLQDAAEKIGARIAGILSGKIDPEKEAKDRAAEKAARQEKKTS